MTEEHPPPNDSGVPPESPPLGQTLPPPPAGTSPLDPSGPDSDSSSSGFLSNRKWVIAGAAVGAVVILALVGALVSNGSSSKAGPTTTTTTTEATTTTVPRTTTSMVTTTTLPPPILTKAMCTETPPDGMVTKDGNSFTGQCLHFWAHVFQFDAATGPCTLMANYSNSWHKYNFEYGNAILMIDSNQSFGAAVTSTQGKVQLPSNSCAQLGPISQGDNIEVWGIAQGTSSYSTKAGGTNQYLKIGLVDAYKR